MKLTILYTTKYGSTQHCALRLSEHLQSINPHVLPVSEGLASAENADAVVLGIPVYSGSTNRDMRMFIRRHEALLQKKLVGIFILCWDEHRMGEYLENLALTSLSRNVPVTCLGAALDFEQMLEIEKSVLKEYTGYSSSVSRLSEANIIAFATAVKDKLGR